MPDAIRGPMDQEVPSRNAFGTEGARAMVWTALLQGSESLELPRAWFERLRLRSRRLQVGPDEEGYAADLIQRLGKLD